MKNDGFTLFEMLVWFLVIFFFAIIAVTLGRKTFATSLTTATALSDEEVYLATERYIEDGHATIHNGYACVSTITLTNEGYLKSHLGTNKYIEAKVSKLTMLVEEIHYVKKCNY